MRVARLWVATGFASLAALALFVAGTEAQPNTVKQIAPGVWFREGDLKNQGHCNNIIIEMQDYLIIVDANFPSGARAALGDARKVSSKPVKYVFDTHHHGDHSYGNPVWTKEGATTLAYKGVAEEMKRYEPKRWQDTSKQRPDVAELNLPTAEPPQQTFDKSPFVLSDKSRRVEFHFFGWAHTRGDGFVYLPKERILCTGDAVVNGPYNYTADGNVGNWPNVVLAAAKLKPAHVLPGHGGPGGPEVLAGQEQFFVELNKAVKAAVAQNKKLEDISIELPDSVKNWVGPSLKNQVKDAYEEMTQGKPHGEILGGR
ncbi:MAG: MBL fold metallo-hydrolase [Acidobacteria bacterium]|nr:MBL fold metallo-hydrolase [Acidobacteriota bacterium]